MPRSKDKSPRRRGQPIETMYTIRLKGFEPSQIETLKAELNANPHARVVVPISVGQLYHENGKFRDTLDFLWALGFKHFEFVVGDTLQRWTKLIKFPLDQDASTPADITRELDRRTYDTRDEGQTWVGRNDETLRRIGSANYTITYWDDIVPTAGSKREPSIPGFQEKNAFYLVLYQNDPLFKEAIDASVNEYLARFEKKEQRTITKNDLKFGFNYIIEETAALHAMYVEYKRQDKLLLYLAYPRGINAALKYARTNCFGVRDEVYPFTELKLGIQVHREDISPAQTSSDSSVEDSLAKSSENLEIPRNPQDHSGTASLDQLATSHPHTLGSSPFAFFAGKLPSAASVPLPEKDRALLLRLLAANAESLAANAESSRLQMEMLFQMMNSPPNVVVTDPQPRPQNTPANIDVASEGLAGAKPVRIQ